MVREEKAGENRARCAGIHAQFRNAINGPASGRAGRRCGRRGARQLKDSNSENVVSAVLLKLVCGAPERYVRARRPERARNVLRSPPMQRRI